MDGNNIDGKDDLLRVLMRPEKRPKASALKYLRTAFMSKKAHGIGVIAAKTGKSSDEILTEMLERLRSCRAIVEADPETFKPDALEKIDKMIASALAARS